MNTRLVGILIDSFPNILINGLTVTLPLVVAGVYSAFLIGKAMAVVEEFMNIHIATNIGLTIVLFLLVYGSYFLATYLSCKRIVTEQRELEV